MVPRATEANQFLRAPTAVTTVAHDSPGATAGEPSGHAAELPASRQPPSKALHATRWKATAMAADAAVATPVHAAAAGGRWRTKEKTDAATFAMPACTIAPAAAALATGGSYPLKC